MNKLEQSYIINKDSQHQYILAQIDHLDRQNKKLVSIADNILKTSFLRPSDQKPAIILQFQEDMRTSFKALIDSIREFFINIDEKMERLGTIVQAKFQESDLEKSKPHPKRFSNQPDKLESLMERMTLLEHNLKKTQENQSKLISIIEAMTNKRSINDDEPTMIRSRDKHFNFQKEEPRQVKSHETSFRLFSMQDMHGINSTQPDSYNLPYNMVNSQVSEKPKNLDRTETFKFNNFCMPQKQESKHIVGENFLINRRSFEMENSNRIHRLSTLMKALKQ